MNRELPLIVSLVTAGLAAMAQEAPPAPAARAFEVASIKPSDPSAKGLSITAVKGRFLANNATLKSLIIFAYDIPDSRLLGQPKWLDGKRFGIVAKLPEGRVTLRLAEFRQTVQVLLRDRFHLDVHTETRDLPFYALVVDKNGPKISPLESVEGDDPPVGMRSSGPGRWDGTRTSIPILANMLTQQTGTSVKDETGLKGLYSFTLEWVPDPAPQGQPIICGVELARSESS